MIKKVETISPAEAAKALGISHRRLILAILNGTCPIGAVAEPQEEGERYSVRVYKARFDKYVKGEL
ncbi:MAG: hypothetical protein ACOXZ0_07050 [Eubacteriales bacterium]